MKAYFITILLLSLFTLPAAEAFTLYGRVSNDSSTGVIGVWLHKNVVTKVMENSPAEACIKEKDIIVEADLYKGSGKVIGKPYTYCNLTIQRGETLIEYSLMRLPDQMVYGHSIVVEE